MLSLDDQSRRRLALAKAAFRRGTTLGRPPAGSANRVLAVVAYDFALETVVKAALGALTEKVGGEERLPILVKRLTERLAREGRPVDGARAYAGLAVRGVRNAAQHEARSPNPDEVGDSRTHTADLLEDVLGKVWGVALRDVGVADAVQHQAFRERLRAGEQALDAGALREACHQATGALALALHSVNETYLGLPDRTIETFGGGVGFLARHALARLARVTSLLLCGVDLNGWEWCKDIAGNPIVALNGEVVFQGGADPPTQEEAEFVVAFCAEGVLDMEARIGDLARPFGYPRPIGARRDAPVEDRSPAP